MKFVIITGMSGAGKSQAIKVFEDIGYYCIDNMPPKLFSKFAEICTQSDGVFSNIAFAIDTRSGNMFRELPGCLDEFERTNGKCEILFLDADNEILIKRYKESRRKHPLSGDGGVLDGINTERKLLADIRKRATCIVDTSNMKPKQLGDYIRTVFAADFDDKKSMAINVQSFGFKYGIPIDADLVFDVRFLPNPFYIPELKDKTGLDTEVSSYVMNFDVSKDFVARLNDIFDFLVPNYIKEGKSNLLIAVGCTGGKHRSVAITEALSEHLRKQEYGVVTMHRDYQR